MSDSVIIRCPNCKAKNKVPVSRVAQRPVCGSCQTPLTLKSSMPAELSDTNFRDEVLGSELPAVVMFYAPWCSVCKGMIPAVGRLATETSGRFKVAVVNVDKNNLTANTYDIQGVPTNVFFRDGQETDRKVGGLSYSALKGWVEYLLEKQGAI